MSVLRNTLWSRDCPGWHSWCGSVQVYLLGSACRDKSCTASWRGMQHSEAALELCCGPKGSASYLFALLCQGSAGSLGCPMFLRCCSWAWSYACCWVFPMLLLLVASWVGLISSGLTILWGSVLGWAEFDSARPQPCAFRCRTAIVQTAGICWPAVTGAANLTVGGKGHRHALEPWHKSRAFNKKSDIAMDSWLPGGPALCRARVT